MKRLIAIALLLIAVPLVLVFGIGANNNGGGSGYKVRAIFDFVRAVPGEDVKVAGAKVGKIDSLHVTPDNKAAVVLRIDDAGFTPFHTDAHCTIRPQSLIGETFAECSPGSSNAPLLPKIQKGDGKGQHLLPLSHTSSPVDIDEINDIMREPTRERLAILINEFGTALAGRGKDLNAAIHRANPALRDTDKVLAILANQNRTLASRRTPIRCSRRWPPSASRWPTSSPRPTRQPRPRPSGARTSRPGSRASPRSCVSSSPRSPTSATCPTR